MSTMPGSLAAASPRTASNPLTAWWSSWLNQVEIYFSIVQRKVLTPNDFPDLGTLAERLLDFQYYWESAAKPFEWKFNRQDLNDLLSKLNNPIGKIE